METPQSVYETPVRNNRTLWIIAAAVMALCCCGLVVAVAGFYGFFTIRSVATQVIPNEFPTPPLDFATPQLNADPGEAPTGGLGNDILRNDTWTYVAAAAVGQGCDQPIGPNSTIEVLQQPDANGVWVEKWTVACGSGDPYAFEVTFTPDSTGATFNIKSVP
ncbi:MAG TPA: hypothetical protein VK249_29120 [Anaerolineales bacterium]|nr:hypothetical protein [Anaerolineales bacterium]